MRLQIKTFFNRILETQQVLHLIYSNNTTLENQARKSQDYKIQLRTVKSAILSQNNKYLNQKGFIYLLRVLLAHIIYFFLLLYNSAFENDSSD